MQVDDVPLAEKVRECAGCGGPGRYEVWDKPMCLGCAHAWDLEAPNDAAWDSQYPEDKARFAAKKKFTAGWCANRRARAA